MLSEYFAEIKHALDVIENDERQTIDQAVKVMTEVVESGNIIHVFGCGHSHMMAEEMFYRAGGLAPVRPILIEELMLHQGGSKSSKYERMNGFAETFMKEQDIRNGDVVIVVSNSGRNPVPVDVGRISKEKGAFVIGLTSLEASEDQPSRHKEGIYLKDAVDLVLDNHIKPGDTVFSLENRGFSYAPLSSVIGMALLNGIVAQVIDRMIAGGKEPPVFRSGNIDGSDSHNKKLIDDYQARISLL
ncbi:SIS domain-containing protein [Alkalihalobacillus sp. R86527]|uniref:SIS domain-containing protein n=1 Tax=Alkalihalobacillus sp. R86527 TaxID=3093863 RepID=UPI00366EF8E9